MTTIELVTPSATCTPGDLSSCANAMHSTSICPADHLSAALVRAGKGDDRAFAAFHAATSAKLLGVIIRIVGRRDVAEDIMQDVYLTVWQRASSFDPSLGSPMTWLYAIARNRALDTLRRKTFLSIEDCPEHADVACDGDDAFDTLAQDEDIRRLDASLDRLPPERRQILLMAYDQGLSRDEIATRTGRPVGTVKTLIHRAVADLKRQATL
jgi:RNA polymerase sigma-70 factor (ECF subfamily)